MAHAERYPVQEAPVGGDNMRLENFVGRLLDKVNGIPYRHPILTRLSRLPLIGHSDSRAVLNPFFKIGKDIGVELGMSPDEAELFSYAMAARITINNSRRLLPDVSKEDAKEYFEDNTRSLAERIGRAYQRTNPNVDSGRLKDWLETTIRMGYLMGTMFSQNLDPDQVSYAEILKKKAQEIKALRPNNVIFY
ncbi:hypothetical protein M1615_01550 [Patescibacteria group bacterium]|nr:hypothetical protein [Patescibacteria group bacterium]MCL5010272.1 hypothetical protein [Patescibacteria group bacterium]